MNENMTTEFKTISVSDQELMSNNKKITVKNVAIATTTTAVLIGGIALAIRGIKKHRSKRSLIDGEPVKTEVK